MTRVIINAARCVMIVKPNTGTAGVRGGAQRALLSLYG